MPARRPELGRRMLLAPWFRSVCRRPAGRFGPVRRIRSPSASPLRWPSRRRRRRRPPRRRHHAGTPTRGAHVLHARHRFSVGLEGGGEGQSAVPRIHRAEPKCVDVVQGRIGAFQAVGGRFDEESEVLRSHSSPNRVQPIPTMATLSLMPWLLTVHRPPLLPSTRSCARHHWNGGGETSSAPARRRTVSRDRCR